MDSILSPPQKTNGPFPRPSPPSHTALRRVALQRYLYPSLVVVGPALAPQGMSRGSDLPLLPDLAARKRPKSHREPVTDLSVYCISFRAWLGSWEAANLWCLKAPRPRLHAYRQTSPPLTSRELRYNLTQLSSALDNSNFALSNMHRTHRDSQFCRIA